MAARCFAGSWATAAHTGCWLVHSAYRFPLLMGSAHRFGGQVFGMRRITRYRLGQADHSDELLAKEHIEGQPNPCRRGLSGLFRFAHSHHIPNGGSVQQGVHAQHTPWKAVLSKTFSLQIRYSCAPVQHRRTVTPVRVSYSPVRSRRCASANSSSLMISATRCSDSASN